MIKNIIFDLSGVLLKYDIKKYLTSINIAEDEQEIYKKLIWGSEEWLKGDAGKMSYEEITDSLCRKYPKHEKMRYILENKNNDLLLSEIKESTKYVKELKDRGYKIYILSNVCKEDIEYNINRFDFFKLADGAVYSCDVLSIKPDKECFYALLKKYNLNKEECIFIDDTKENIEASNKLGIKSVLFDTIDSVKEKVEELLNCR